MIPAEAGKVPIPTPNHVRSILDAAAEGRALVAEEALRLLQLQREDDLFRLRETADALRKQQTGEAIQYTTGCSLYLTNLDEVGPTIYGYSRKPGDNGTWTLTIDEIDACLERTRNRSLQRIYVSGGGFCSFLQVPGLEAPTALKTYARIIGYIRERNPELRIIGFSPDEIEFLRVVSDRGERYLMELLKDQGLQGLGGNGAEILVDAVRQKISPKKATVKRWFEIAATAHALDLPVAINMESGHFETLEQRVTHLMRVRDFLKKAPGAFSLLIPRMWTGIPEAVGSSPKMPGAAYRSPRERFKLLAVSRLILGETLPVQQTFWQPDGMEEAQEGLQWGASYFGATDCLADHAFLNGSRQLVEFTEDEFKRLLAETGQASERLPSD